MLCTWQQALPSPTKVLALLRRPQSPWRMGSIVRPQCRHGTCKTSPNRTTTTGTPPGGEKSAPPSVLQPYAPPASNQTFNNCNPWIIERNSYQTLTLNCFNQLKRGPCAWFTGNWKYPPSGSSGKMFANRPRMSFCQPIGGMLGPIAAPAIGNPVSMATS